MRSTRKILGVVTVFLTLSAGSVASVALADTKVADPHVNKQVLQLNYNDAIEILGNKANGDANKIDVSTYNYDSKTNEFWVPVFQNEAVRKANTLALKHERAAKSPILAPGESPVNVIVSRYTKSQVDECQKEIAAIATSNKITISFGYTPQEDAVVIKGSAANRKFFAPTINSVQVKYQTSSGLSRAS